MVFLGEENLPGSPKLPPHSFVHRPIGKERREGRGQTADPISFLPLESVLAAGERKKHKS